jgi:hypothetical protein
MNQSPNDEALDYESNDGEDGSQSKSSIEISSVHSSHQESSDEFEGINGKCPTE